MAESQRKFLHEQVGETIVRRIKAIPREISHTLTSKFVQGAYELGGLWTGDSYRGDLGLLTSGAAPGQAPQRQDGFGVHGPGDAPRMEAEIDKAMHGQEQQLEPERMDPVTAARLMAQQAGRQPERQMER